MKQWAVSLPRFEGPLDLLLSLVRRDQIDLANLPVAEITRQYLEYLHQADQLDVNLGAEYVDMAATLIQLKSRLLLPQDPELAAREADPRQELVRQLLDHQQVRQAAEFLRQKLEFTEASFSQPSIEEFRDIAPDDEQPTPGVLNLLDVLRLAKRALDTARVHQNIDTAPDPVTTSDMIAWIEARIDRLSPTQTADALPWFDEQDSQRRKVVLLLAILELVRRGPISVSQPHEFGEIQLRRLR